MSPHAASPGGSTRARSRSGADTRLGAALADEPGADAVGEWFEAESDASATRDAGEDDGLVDAPHDGASSNGNEARPTANGPIALRRASNEGAQQ